MTSARPIYFSFFMFDSNARLHDEEARVEMIRHMKALMAMGYAGFELHIGRGIDTEAAFPSYEDEVRAYAAFRRTLDDAGLSAVALATNVGATPELDPSSADPRVRESGLVFLKSRVDITAALGGTIMMGPVVVPYGAFLQADSSGGSGEGAWSDALQEALTARYVNAAPVLDALGAHARRQGVNVAIEPITHWETPGPNKLCQTMEFLRSVPATEIGVVIDSAHEVLDGDGPEVFGEQVLELARAGRLHYVQASPPDRGGLASSWLPWDAFFRPILSSYRGPVAIEIFNSIPPFAAGLRLSRRKYWIPGVDPESALPSAYDVARSSLVKLRAEFGRLES